MGKPRILIVEDEHIVAMDIQNYLERNGYQTAGHTDRGEEAIQQALSLLPDLVLMDINLKGTMDGIEAASQIRMRHHIPVVFLTAFANQSTIERARLAEPYGYLLKPFDERELIAAIEMALYKNSMEQRLRESEAKFRGVVENASDGIAMIDRKGTVAEWNAALETITGLLRADVLGKPIWDAIFQTLPRELKSEQMQGFLRTEWQREIASGYSGKDHVIEREIETPQGTRKTIQSNGFALTAPQDMMGGVIVRDVTEHKKMERELIESQTRLQSLIKNVPVILFALDKNGVFTLSEGKGLTALGLQPSDVLGHSAFEIYRDYPNVIEIIKQALAGEIQSAIHDMGNLVFDVYYTPILDENGQRNGVIGVATDISERMKTEKEIRKLSRAVEQSANSIIVTDTDGKIEYINPRFTQVCGYTLEEVLGETPRILRSGEHPTEYYQILWQTIKSGRIWHGQFHNRRKDGTLFWEDATIAPVYDADGKMINFIAIKEDITLRKMLEEQERDQHMLAEALRDTAIILNTSLKLDDVLDGILDNIGRLVPYDAAMVSLVDGDSIRKIRYRNNPHVKTHQVAIGNMQANLLNIPVLKALMQAKQPLLVADVHSDPRWQAITIPEMKRIRSMISAPIEAEEHVIGIINLVSGEPNFFTNLHAERIMDFANQAAMAIKNAQLYERTQHLSLTDPLTGLFNMRYFRDFASLELERVKRYARTLSLAMLDLDHFKNINDQYGHAVGDWVLSEVATRIKNSIRTVDVVARYGGEEFIVLMPETDFEEAFTVSERVRKSLADRPFENNGAAISVTLSLGLAELSPEIADLDDLIRLADHALYQAKENGRNQVWGYQAQKS